MLPLPSTLYWLVLICWLPTQIIGYRAIEEDMGHAFKTDTIQHFNIQLVVHRWSTVHTTTILYAIDLV
jgi:hypothetical protein